MNGLMFQASTNNSPRLSANNHRRQSGDAGQQDVYKHGYGACRSRAGIQPQLESKYPGLAIQGSTQDLIYSWDTPLSNKIKSRGLITRRLFLYHPFLPMAFSPPSPSLWFLSRSVYWLGYASWNYIRGRFAINRVVNIRIMINRINKITINQGLPVLFLGFFTCIPAVIAIFAKTV